MAKIVNRSKNDRRSELDRRQVSDLGYFKRDQVERRSYTERRKETDRRTGKYLSQTDLLLEGSSSNRGLRAIVLSLALVVAATIVWNVFFN
ncbi:MAG: hypothetical protein QNI91_11870 [Arenicellales bacterium]|nr:hypothetical protein [Arenicellales bacterium]